MDTAVSTVLLVANGYAAQLQCVLDYTVNHKKRDILFLTITLANLNRLL